MRVMHVVAHLSTYGAENLVAQLAAEMKAASISVSVLTISDTPPSARTRTFEGSVFSAGRRNRYDLPFLARMVSLMRDWKPSIVHTHTHNGKYWGRLAATLAGVPHIVHTEHNSVFRADAIEKFGNRFLHPRTERFIAFSEVHADALASAEHISRSKIVVIPNGIAQPPAADRRLARDRLGIEESAKVIFQVGRLAAVKNQQLAIRALHLLPQYLKERATLFFAGAGRDEPMLRGLAEEVQLTERVRFLGFRADLETILPAADVALVTSLNEAMPLSILEAMSARVPIVTTPWLGSRALLEPGSLGLICRDWSPQSVATALSEVFADAQGANARAARAQATAKTRYDISITARKHIEMYESLSGSRFLQSADVRNQLAHDHGPVVTFR